MILLKDNQTEKDKMKVLVRIGMGFLLILVFFVGSHLSVRAFLAEVDFYRAYHLLNTSAYLEAETLTKRAVRLNPTNGYTYYYYGVFLRKIGDNDEALEMFSSSLRTIAHPASVLKQLAPLEMEQKKYQKALDHYRLTLLYNPIPSQSPASYWYDYGRSAEKAGFPGEALYAFRKAQTFENPPRILYNSLGIILAFLGARASGVEEYVYTIGKYPDSIKELPPLAVALSRVNLLDFGNALFSRLDAMGKLDANGLCLFASFPFQKKDYETALKILERARNRDPNEPDVFLLMGEIYYRKQDKQAMKSAYKRFLELNPEATQRVELEKRIQE